ncbi:hypothetical protein ACWGCW_06000 [Streptomyces sp. NPDC054933]
MNLILSGDDDAVWELEEQTDDDPAALRPYLVRLLDAEMYVPESLFRAADEDLQRAAVARVDAGAEDWDYLVTVLTATRGPVAEAAFGRWLKQPPAGMELDAFTGLLHRNGWDFDTTGQARQLCGTTAYQLVPGTASEPAEGQCPWCGGRLWTVLDVDTADPRVAAALAHASWRGRLRIVSCYLCSTYGNTYAQVTPDGGSAWSAHTVQPRHLRERELEKADPPRTRLTPGEPRPALYLGGDGESEGTSTLGGQPGWVQDPHYPACPACGKVMSYVGAVTGADIAEAGVGTYFLFLHEPCELAAVVSQFS